MASHSHWQRRTNLILATRIYFRGVFLPELPEVETIVRGIQAYLTGCQIKDFRFFRRDLRRPMPTDEVRSRLIGQTVTQVIRRSKYIVIETTGGRAIIHLGMTGNLLVRNSDEPAFPHTHYVIALNSGLNKPPRFLHYVDPRRFGSLSFASPNTAYEMIEEFAELGPEPLAYGDGLGDYLWKMSRRRSQPVKPFLMDAKVIVGVGNIYASESLFLSGVRPTKPANTVSRAAFSKIGDAIVSTLNAAILAGGTTLRDFQQADGKPGYFRVALNVYGRAGEGCKSCGGRIQSLRQSGRATFFCPKCQR